MSAFTGRQTLTVARHEGNAGRQKRVGQILLYTTLVAIALLFIVPIIWLILSSLKTETEYNAYPIRILPRVWQWKNYFEAVEQRRGIRGVHQYVGWALRSLGLCALNGIPDVLVSAMVGFGFARQRVRVRNLFFTVMLSMVMVPGLVTTIPQFVLFTRFHLIGTYWPWLLWGLASTPYFVFMFRQFFASFPKELEDAAEIDGCNRLRVFWQIMMPSAGPVVATCAIFSFQGNWGDWFAPTLFLTGDKQTMAMALANAYQDPAGNPMVVQTMAAIVLFIIPTVIAYFLGERRIRESAITSGLKG